jgi:ribosomal-protein-alanine N-acetyltransferase
LGRGDLRRRCLLKHSIVDGRGEVEIGWAVGHPYWGRGLGTSMGRHVLRVASERGITNVCAFTRVDNFASQRVMEKLGLTFEREFQHAGLPHVLYRTIRESKSR